MKHTRSRGAGMALISVIFLTAVLVALGASLVTMSQVQQDTGTKSLLGAKVYYGAKAGLEWGIQQAIAAGTCNPSTNPSNTFTFPATQGALGGVTVVIDCSAGSTLGSGGSAGKVYYLTSAATTGVLGRSNYAERHLAATVSNIP